MQIIGTSNEVQTFHGLHIKAMNVKSNVFLKFKLQHAVSQSAKCQDQIAGGMEIFKCGRISIKNCYKQYKNRLHKH